MSINSLNIEPDNGSCLIIAPHCDDELLACGGIIQQALACNVQVEVIFLTNGDGFRWAAIRNFKRPYITASKYKMLGQIRQREALVATECLGLKRENVHFLGYPDGGLKSLWSENWSTEKPLTSHYTKVNANPYSLAYKLEQKYTGEDLIANLGELITSFNPQKIFISSSYDNHPDHRAAYNFLKYTICKLKLENKITNYPEIYQYLVHWNRWPLSPGIDHNSLRPPFELVKVNKNWSNYLLTNKQKEMKLISLKKYRTQMNVMKKYLESFVKNNEIFIIDHCEKIYLTKTVNSDLNQIRVPSINRNIIFYEPSRKKYRFKRKIVTDIRGIKLGFSKKHLFINLFFLNNYSSKQKFKIRAIIITKGKSRVKSRDFELTIPAKSNSEFILNQYINSKKWLTRDMVHVYWRKESIKIRIDNPAFQKESYFFLTAGICKKGRIVDRTSWKVIKLIS